MIKPQLCAFTTRRQVTPVASARITIAHWNYCNSRFIVKNVLANAHPNTQTFAARVVPGNTASVHAQTRRLPYYKDLSRWSGTQHRTRTERKLTFTYTA